jgi:energy-converting hydrogenase B subunit D
MADALTIAALLLAAFMATAVVLTRDPSRQAIVLSAYGLALAVLFVVLQAPDVALSQTAIGTVVVPLIVMLAVHAVRRHHTREPDDGDER